MSPSLITLIINLVLVAFVGIGFLLGLKGIKKATFNLCSFIIQLIVIFLLSPVVSNAILKISISGKTINDHIIGAVNNMLGADMASSQFVQDIVSAAPVMIVNILTTILMVIAVGLVFKLIGIIVYKLMFKKDKDKVVEKCEIVNGAPQMIKVPVKKKKHRLAGGFVGAFNGLLVALVMFMPLCGLVSIFNDVAGTSAAYAETESNQELLSSQELLQKNLPKEVFDYAKAIDGSLLFKIGKIGNISETSLNIVAKSSINGSAVRLGEEIRTIVDTYDTFVDFALSTESELQGFSLATIFNDIIENPENYDFTKLNNTVDKLFKSNLVNSLGKDALVFVVDILVNNSPDGEILKILTHIQEAVNNYAESEHTLRGEIDAIVGVFETAVKSGLVKEFKKDEIKIDDISNILLNDANPSQNIEKNEVLGKICDKLTGSYLLQKLILELGNYGLDTFEAFMNKKLKTTETQEFTLIKIDSSKDYALTSAELEGFVSEGLGLYEIVEGMDFKVIENDLYNIFDMDVQTFVKGVGRVLNNLVNISMLDDTGVFESICDAMAKTEYNNYIDFELLKTENTIETQFNLLSDAIGEIKESGVINTIRYINDENREESINQIIDKLALTFDGQPYVARIVTPLLGCSLVKNGFEYVLGKAHDFLEEKLIALNPDATLTNFNTQGLMTADENAQLINVLNNLVQFLDEIDISKLSSDEFVTTIIYSDLNNVGRAFEAIRTANLFKDYDGHQGVYGDIIDALNGSKFADYFDFAVAKDSQFTWTNTAQKLVEIRDELDKTTITTEQGETKILTYVLSNGSFDELITKLKGKTIDFSGVFELDIFKPLSLKLINTINQTIKDFVEKENGEKVNNLGANIVDIDKTANLAIQSQSINNIINCALSVDLEAIDIENITPENQEKLNALIDALEANAKSEEFDGVFKESYNALLLKTINLINKSIKDFVGGAGTKIVVLSESANVIAYSDSVQSLLNTAILLAGEISSIDLAKDGMADSIIEMVDAFKLASVSAPELFGATYNSLLLYSTNAINSAVAQTVGDAFNQNIKEYSDSNTNITSLYDYVIDVILSSAEIFNIISKSEEGTELSDLAITNETELTKFKNALNSNDYTRDSYTAVMNYLADSILA